MKINLKFLTSIIKEINEVLQTCSIANILINLSDGRCIIDLQANKTPIKVWA